MVLIIPTIQPSSLGGSSYQGISPVQFANNAKTGAEVIDRRVIRSSWNNAYATGNVNNYARKIGPFRAVTNLGDFLGRQYYSCGGSNQVTLDRYKRKNNVGGIPQNCDTTGVPASICNTRFVPDSSDYTRYKRTQAANRTYNDLTFGGDQHNASYVPLMAVRRF